MGTRHLIKRILLFLLIGAPTLAKADDVDVKKVVFEHLSDSYEWHICSWGDNAVVLPLPVIVRGNNGAWRIFSSSHIRNGESYEGFSIATDGRYKGKVVEQGKAGQPQRPSIDLSLTKNALALLINTCVLLLIVLPLARWYKRGTMESPKGFRGLVELVVEYIQNEVIEPCIGNDYRHFSPYLLTIFFFILVNNLMGLIPFFPAGANVTGNIAITLLLALSAFLVVNFSGTKAYWKDILWPDVPTWLKVPMPIMPVIELFGIFTKPFALMIRLFANMFAGHAVIIGLVCVIFITASMGAAISTGMTVVSVLFSVFMLCLELLVAFIQAYVFTLLTAVFIGMARVKHEKQEKKQV